MRQGRPTGSTTYEAEPARAFGMAVRAVRTRASIAQEELANRAGIDRSHMGKIERGEHMPTLAIILRVAEALGVTSALLMAETEENLKSLREPPDTKD